MVFLLLPCMAVAQEARDVHPILESKYAINVGLYYPSRSFRIGVDASIPTIGRDIDISEELNLETSESTGALEIGWRFGEKWILRGQYFTTGGDRSVVLGEDVQWGDYTFGAGTGVSGGIDVGVIRAFVGRTYRADDRQELGIGAGVHRIEIEAFLAGQAIINNEPPLFTERRVKTNGPLPNVGAWYIYALSPKWALATRLDWLSASIDRYDGMILNASAGLSYAFNEHFLVGLNYNYFEVDVTVNEDSWTGNVEQIIDGPFLYMGFHW